MSHSPEKLLSNSSNAPLIPSSLYLPEKEAFAGLLVGAVFYGIVVALFFQCIGVLLSPVNPIKKGTKWTLLVHTVAMFTFLTIPFGIFLNNKSICYINNREYPGDDQYPPGPFGYWSILNTEGITTVFNIMFPLNQWLADGLLLHRCYIIYSMNYWVMAFPCMMYLTSVVMGVAHIYQGSGTRLSTALSANLDTSYFSISLSLNIILTLMIVARLIMHIRNVRKAIGASEGARGLYSTTATVVTMLIESYALYAVIFLLYIVCWAIDNWAFSIFSNTLGASQVIAPYLITLRVANQRALASNTISGTFGSIHFGTKGTTYSDGSLADGSPVDSMEVKGEAPDEPGDGVVGVIEEAPL